ncbi:CmcI family methyltransferase [Nocardioides nanhaiensis]|uniref:Rhamnosyl O-methyltransferase n=1 Tax=Nocardioides nanhaiensis TaxID=1476871 RepID=A0ABP8W382_9ACTN
MTDRLSRLRSAAARRLDPRAGQQPGQQPGRPAQPAERSAPSRREVREFLDTLDPASVGGPMQESLAGAFRALWQPRTQPVPEPPAAVRDAIVDQFHLLYYHVSRRTWKDTFYRGTRAYKCPTDMWVYQELIDDLKPGLVIETGTFRGGSALFIADRLQLAGRGQVVTIDVDVQPNRPQHPRLTYLTGSSVDPAILAQVHERIDPALPVLVILDSDHSAGHVAAELEAYAPLVTEGSYLIVEDTNVNGHPAAPEHGPGPFEAAQEFLARTEEFEVDERCERYFLTQNPQGYLKRVRPAPAAPAATGTPATADARAVVTAPLETGPASAAVQAVGELTITDADDAGDPSVVLVLQAFEPGQFFAGIRTAVLAAARLAAELARPLRVVVVSPARGGSDHAEARAALAELVRAEGLPDVAEGLRLSTPAQRDAGGHTGHDVWLATYWTTAHALAVAARAGRVDPERVVYLVQDYEPGFYPWGPEHAQALATYGAGFRPLVNSASLARYLTDQTGARPAAVFAPALDPAPMHAAAERWRPAADAGADDEVRVLFYARPGKPRNMYDAGLTALRLWAEALPAGLTGVVRLAGETLPGEVHLGGRARVEPLGKLSYEDYHRLLEETDLGLALMLSPHPGHLALELPMAGIPTVTNTFGGYREAWVDGLHLAGTDPHDLAGALLRLTEETRGAVRHEARLPGEGLGGTLEDAVRQVAAELGRG